MRYIADEYEDTMVDQVVRDLVDLSIEERDDVYGEAVDSEGFMATNPEFQAAFRKALLDGDEHRLGVMYYHYVTDYIGKYHRSVVESDLDLYMRG